MRYMIETNYPKTSFWNWFFPKKIFKPGWYGGTPYLKMSAPYTDGIGRQHVDLKVSTSCHDQSIVGNTVAHAHIPSGYTLVSHYDIVYLIKILDPKTRTSYDINRAINFLKEMGKIDRKSYHG